MIDRSLLKRSQQGVRVCRHGRAGLGSKTGCMRALIQIAASRPARASETCRRPSTAELALSIPWMMQRRKVLMALQSSAYRGHHRSSGLKREGQVAGSPPRAHSRQTCGRDGLVA